MSHDTVVRFEKKGVVVDLLSELLRVGARQLVEQAVLAEVEEFLGEHAGRCDKSDRRAVVRNGYHPEREVLTGLDPVTVKVPKVRDRLGEGGRVFAPRSCRRTCGGPGGSKRACRGWVSTDCGRSPPPVVPSPVGSAAGGVPGRPLTERPAVPQRPSRHSRGPHRPGRRRHPAPWTRGDDPRTAPVPSGAKGNSYSSRPRHRARARDRIAHSNPSESMRIRASRWDSQRTRFRWSARDDHDRA